MRSLLLVLSLVGFVAAPSAQALCVSKHYEVRAWNRDATAVLIERGSHGPEGGGEKAFLIVDFSGTSFPAQVLSSNFSPGNGSAPQRISKTHCREVVTKTNEALTKLGFEAKLSPKGCGTDSRTGLLPAKPAKETPLQLNGRRVRIVENGTCSARCSWSVGRLGGQCD